MIENKRIEFLETKGFRYSDKSKCYEYKNVSVAMVDLKTKDDKDWDLLILDISKFIDSIVTDFKKLTDNKSNSFLAEIKEQNKLKVWVSSPIKIEIKEGHLWSNNVEIADIVTNAKQTLESTIKTLDLNQVIQQSEDLKIITDYIKGNRINLTTPFDNMKKSFTASESILVDMQKTLKAKSEELQEEIYKVRKVNIANEFQVLKDDLKSEFDLNIDLKVFEDFMNTKKKAKVFDLNSKGLSSSAKKQIKEQFDLVANPLIEAKKQRDIVDKEQQFLTKELSSIKTMGTDEELQNSIKELNVIDANIKTLYSNVNNAKSQVTNLMQLVQNGIKANEKNSAEIMQDMDDNIVLDSMSEIDFESDDFEYLLRILERYENNPKFVNMLEKNNKKYRNNITKIDNRIKKLKEKALLESQQPKEGIYKDRDLTDSDLPISTQRADVPRGTIEDGFKVVEIQATLKFKVKENISDKLIVDKIWKMLNDAGLKESLESVEVV